MILQPGYLPAADIGQQPAVGIASGVTADHYLGPFIEGVRILHGLSHPAEFGSAAGVVFGKSPDSGFGPCYSARAEEEIRAAVDVTSDTLHQHPVSLVRGQVQNDIAP